MSCFSEGWTERLSLTIRDTLGSNVVVGDLRWAGAYGVNADFVAMTHCAVEFISTEDIKVCSDY